MQHEVHLYPFARVAEFDVLRIGLDEALDFPFAVAAKTGTSQAYHDNWTVGFTRDVATQLNKMDLFVLPSLFGEGLPMVVLEALANVNRELGTTTAIITHNASIGGMADRVIHFSDGHIAGIDQNSQKISPQDLSW